MVRYYDDTGVLDAPLDMIWKMMEAHTDEALPKIHPVFRSVRTVKEEDNTVEREVEVTSPSTGRPEKAKLRVTVNAPAAFTVEYLSGSLARTWFTNTLVPEGDKTRIVCTGDLHIDGMDDASTLKIGGAMLDDRFEEDRAFLDTLKQSG